MILLFAIACNSDEEPPQISSVFISPSEEIVIGSELTCRANTQNAENSTLSYQWILLGEEVGRGATYTTTSGNVGYELTCTATLKTGPETTQKSTSVTIKNTPPTIENIHIISSGSFYNNDILYCEVDIIDPDEDPNVIYAWSSTERYLGGQAELDLSQTNLLPNDEITCKITVADQFGEIAEALSTERIQNRLPDKPALTITWNSSGMLPSTVDNISCSASSEDPDNQELFYEYFWQSSDGNIIEGNTLDPLDTDVNETWICSVAAFDGEFYSETTQEEIFIMPKYGDCDLSFNLGDDQAIEMVLIPAGSFLMGSPENEIGRGGLFDETQHEVTLTNNFYIMTTEFTQGMSFQLLRYNSLDGKLTSNNFGSLGVGDDYPIYHVTWDEAVELANLATQLHNTLYNTTWEECYSCSQNLGEVSCETSGNPYECSGFRLPTEAEWEYAARSGTQDAYWTPNGGGNLLGEQEVCDNTWVLSDGSYLHELAWFFDNSTPNQCNTGSYGAKEVALKPPNAWRLFDTMGNVYEWVQDHAYNHSASPETDPWYGENSLPLLADSPNYHILKGGSWNGSLYYNVRLAHRTASASSFSNIGFRLVRTAE